MKVHLKNGATKKDIEAIEKAIYGEQNTGGFNAKKYNGILRLPDDPLVIQRNLRNEWDREISKI